MFKLRFKERDLLGIVVATVDLWEARRTPERYNRISAILNKLKDSCGTDMTAWGFIHGLDLAVFRSCVLEERRRMAQWRKANCERAIADFRKTRSDSLARITGE